MKPRVLALAAVALLAACRVAQAGEILDRIVATVNGHIILQSDWADALRYEAFVDNRSLDQFPLTERKAALDRLIDQELLQEQMRASDFRHATEEEVRKRIAEIRSRYPGSDGDQGWRAVLDRFGFTEDGLKQPALPNEAPWPGGSGSMITTSWPSRWR